MATTTDLSKTRSGLFQRNVDYDNNESVVLVAAETGKRVKVWFISISCDTGGVLSLTSIEEATSATSKIFDFYVGNNWGDVRQAVGKEPLYETDEGEALNFASNQTASHNGNVFIKYTIEP